MKKIIHLDLFSGIGGASLAVDAVWGTANVEHIFCDNEPFSQAILKKHWPEAKIYGDIRTLTNADFYGLYEPKNTKSNRTGKDSNPKGKKKLRQPQGSDPLRPHPFIITGGFPCQPFSQAGRRKGTADDRHLWPEMFRVIREFQPEWVIGENVAGFVTWNEGMVLEQACTDLESEGYEVQTFVIPAVAVNAPHRRDRVWIVAHKNSIGKRNGGRSNEFKEGKRKRMEAKVQDAGSSWGCNWIEVATRLCLVDDGLPSRLARPRGWRNAALKGAGNAWVPQVAIEIMKGIKSVDERMVINTKRFTRFH